MGAAVTDEEVLARRAAWARARRARKRNGETGWRDRVPIAEVRDLVCMEILRGSSPRLIAAEAGVEVKSIETLFRPERTFVEAATERAIRVGVARARAMRERKHIVSPDRVLAEPYRTKMRRLAAAGWTFSYLRDTYGIPDGAWRDRLTYISHETAAKIEYAYRDIDGAMGPNIPVARRWRARGYLVPAAETVKDQLGLPRTAKAERERRARARARTRNTDVA